MNATEFRPIFERVCCQSIMRGEDKNIAWEACFDGLNAWNVSDRAVSIYRILAATEGPYEPRR